MSDAQTMAAGRDLDLLIGKTAMGYTVYHYDKDYEAHCYYSLCDADGDPVAPDFTKGRARMLGERKTEAEAWADCPPFSTNAIAALDALAKVGGIVVITRIWPNEWRVTICGETRWAETLPLAICVTLLAVSTPKVAA